MTGLQKAACALLLAMAVAAAVCIRPADGSSERPSEDVTYAPYTVQYGDTLWGIAREHKPDGANTRDYMDCQCQIKNVGKRRRNFACF